MDDSNPNQNSAPIAPASRPAVVAWIDDPRVNLDQLGDQIQAVYTQLTLQDPQVAVVIVDVPEMARLHEVYSGVPGTTDVLTFDLSEDADDDRKLEGEIYLCLDEAIRQAQQRSHAVELELLLYATHGLLHLMGYDDLDEESHHIMHAREDEILRAIGVGAVYARGDAAR